MVLQSFVQLFQCWGEGEWLDVDFCVYLLKFKECYGQTGSDGTVVVCVDGWLGFCFDIENFCSIREGFYKAFGGLVFIEVVVEGFTSDNKSFDPTADHFMITGHFCGEVLICLDLKFARQV